MGKHSLHSGSRKAESAIVALKPFLEEQVARFNNPAFIASDPVSIPHRFEAKADREISGFLVAAIAWGQRPVILRNSLRLMELLEREPHRFLETASSGEWKRFSAFVHRTFNGIDCVLFMKLLKRVYTDRGGLEPLFGDALLYSDGDMGIAISNARRAFFNGKDPGRSGKHFADPGRNASAKRINMFLRWMVRRDNAGVDLGIWDSIGPQDLCCPLDVHSGRTARELGLLTRKQDDWKAVQELTANLRLLDELDPVRYDFALFGMSEMRK